MDVTLTAIILTAVVGAIAKTIDWLLGRGRRTFDQTTTQTQTTFSQALGLIEQLQKQIEQQRLDLVNLNARDERREARDDANKASEAERVADMRDLQHKVEFLTQRLTAATLERDMYAREIKTQAIQIENQAAKIAALESELQTLRRDLDNREDSHV